MNNKRPKNLDLLSIRFPLPAIVSILHRMSGVVLFLLIPVVLWAFDASLASRDDFLSISSLLATPFAKFVVWLFLAPFLYHFAAGIRHLLMDLGVGDALKSGRTAAVVTLVSAFLLIILAGIYLW